LGKTAIVKHQQELGSVALQALNRVRDAGGKVPQVAFRKILDEAFAVAVNSSEAHAPVEHNPPFRCFVPMQLTASLTSIAKDYGEQAASLVHALARSKSDSIRRV